MSFKIDAEIINNRESDIVTGLKGKNLDDLTLFIDNTLDGTGNIFNTEICEGYSDEGVFTGTLSDLPETAEAGCNFDVANMDFSYQLATGANLSGLIMHNANLSYADLTNVNLSGTDLTNANLTNANLTGANFGSGRFRAIFGNTTCPNGDINSGTSPCTAEQLSFQSLEQLESHLIQEGMN